MVACWVVVGWCCGLDGEMGRKYPRVEPQLRTKSYSGSKQLEYARRVLFCRDNDFAADLETCGVAFKNTTDVPF